MADLSSILAGTDELQTPEEVERRRRQGTALFNQGTSVAPLQHWTQALARGVQGGLGGYEIGQARDQEARGKGAANSALVEALTGGKSPTDTIGTMLKNPWSADAGQKMATSHLSSQMQQNTPQAQMALKLQQAQIRNLDRREEPEIVRTLRAAGIDPKSPEGQQAIMGTVKHRPESALDKKVANETAEIAVKYIQSGDAAGDMMGAVNELKQIAQDPSLVSAIGPVMGDSRYQSTIGRLPLASGNPELNARINRLQQALSLGGTQAFLKGLGSASDAEGRRVEQAVSNLTTSRDAKEFNSNLRIIETGLQRTLARASAAKQRFPQLDVAGYGQPQVPGSTTQGSGAGGVTTPTPGKRQFNDLPRADQRTAIMRMAKDSSPETLKNFEEEFGSEALGRALDAIKKLKSGTAF
jgi:hypothetical protein